MNQAIKNERLVIRQKLVDFYKKRAAILSRDLDELWKSDVQHLSSWGPLEPYLFFETFAVADSNKFNGYLIYDRQGNLAYPIPTNKSGLELTSKQQFEKAWQQEFTENKPARAAAIYKNISDNAEMPGDYFSAGMGMVRCFDKAGKTEQAADICYRLAYPDNKFNLRTSMPDQVFRARLMLVNLYRKTGHQDLLKELRRLLGNSKYDPNSDYFLLPVSCETRIFGLDQLIRTAAQTGLADKLKHEIDKAKKTIRAEQLSLNPTKLYPTAASLKPWPENTIRKINPAQPVYGIHYRIHDQKILCLMTREKMFSYLRNYVNDLADDYATCRIYDNFGKFTAGVKDIETKPFFTSALSKDFPEWKVELYFSDADVFDNAAGKQATAYVWTGILVITLILAIGGAAGLAVSKQIKLNRLKNDFIATVSHELKTPLSSMRILVDTLLEGNYRDQQQVTDYLQMISKENTRLSRLIDNFLTFSRMERNKHTFDLARTKPADIANDAIEAVQTKFNSGKCTFVVNIDDNLPEIHADQDGLVIVLVNLLENAFKYSYDNKDIELKVFTENNSVCFSVRDRGTGLSRRAVKKIFNRFYQVDRSLTRNATGCGLGLSIVKFIVDAHRGTITVDSRPEKGSTFTVRLPKAT